MFGYTTNLSQNKIGKLCFNNGKCSGNYPYYIEGDSTNKECFSSCPQGTYYENRIETNSEDLICYSNGCQNNKFHFDGDIQCLSLGGECKFFDYKKNLCVLKCSLTQLIYNDNNNGVTYCLDNCQDFNGKELYQDFEKNCVETCPIN